VKDHFVHWLDTHLPGQKEKILGRIRETRGAGRLNDSEFGTRMRGKGVVAEHIRTIFRVSRKRHKIDRVVSTLSTEAFTPPRGRQLELFKKSLLL
jgi:hypothetical protein